MSRLRLHFYGKIRATFVTIVDLDGMHFYHRRHLKYSGDRCKAVYRQILRTVKASQSSKYYSDFLSHWTSFA